MSAIEDVISALQIVADQVDEASTANSSAASETDEAMAHAVALGSAANVAQLSALKDGVTKLSEQLASAADLAGELLGRAQAFASGS
jgi:hypothetical protein